MKFFEVVEVNRNIAVSRTIYTFEDVMGLIAYFEDEKKRRKLFYRELKLTELA